MDSSTSGCNQQDNDKLMMVLPIQINNKSIVKNVYICQLSSILPSSSSSSDDNHPLDETRGSDEEDNLIESIVDCFQDHYDQFDCFKTIQIFFKLDPKSFFIAFMNSSDSQDSQPVAFRDHLHRRQIIGICAAPLGPKQIHFLGLYGVHPQYRHLGIGSKLFEKCLQNCHPRNVSLFAVPEMLQKYLQPSGGGGFHFRTRISMVNFVGNPNLVPIQENDEVIIIKLTKDNLNQYESDLIDYDWKIHQEHRTQLLKILFHQQLNDYQIQFILNLKSKKIQGYGCLRQHSKTKRYYLGPLYSDSKSLAYQLACALLLDPTTTSEIQSSIQKYGLIWNVMDSNPEALELCLKFGLQEMERCELLFQRQPSSDNQDQQNQDVQYRFIYSIFSPDFSL